MENTPEAEAGITFTVDVSEGYGPVDIFMGPDSPCILIRLFRDDNDDPIIELTYGGIAMDDTDLEKIELIHQILQVAAEATFKPEHKVAWSSDPHGRHNAEQAAYDNAFQAMLDGEDSIRDGWE